MRRELDLASPGSRHRLPAALAAAVLALAACDDAREGLPEDGLVFWDVPALPQPFEMEVDGQSVDPEVIRGYLLPLWAEHWDGRATLEESTRAFLADPRALFAPLVRGVLLLHEAEQRWPVIEEDELAAFDAEMRRAIGAIHEALLRRVGPDGLRAHQLREIRKQHLLAAFGEEAEPVADDEVYRRYEEMLREVDDPAALARRGVDYEAMAPRIRADLEQTRAVARQEAWIDSQLPLASVVVGLPDGSTHSW